MGMGMHMRTDRRRSFRTAVNSDQLVEHRAEYASEKGRVQAEVVLRAEGLECTQQPRPAHHPLHKLGAVHRAWQLRNGPVLLLRLPSRDSLLC